MSSAAPSWIKMKPFRRRLGGLEADIFNIIGRKTGVRHILQPAKIAKKPLRDRGFTCEQFRNQLMRVSLELTRGSVSALDAWSCKRKSPKCSV